MEDCMLHETTFMNIQASTCFSNEQASENNTDVKACDGRVFIFLFLWCGNIFYFFLSFLCRVVFFFSSSSLFFSNERRQDLIERRVLCLVAYNSLCSALGSVKQIPFDLRHPREAWADLPKDQHSVSFRGGCFRSHFGGGDVFVLVVLTLLRIR